MRLPDIEKYYFRPIKKNRGKTAMLTAMGKKYFRAINRKYFNIFLKRLRLLFQALVTDLLSRKIFFCSPEMFIWQQLTK